MKSFFISMTLIIFAAAASYCQPKISVVGASIIDAGIVYNTGSHILETFQIKNVGDQPLHINGVRTSCGCTAAVSSDSTIQPGKESQIKVDFNPAGYRGDVTKDVFVMTNDPTNQMTTLQVRMNITYALQSTPDFILFQNATVGKPDTSAVTISNTSDEAIEIKNVETGAREMTSHIEVAKLKPGESTRLELYLLGEKAGPVSGEVLVNTTSKAQPKLVLRYYAGIN